MKPKPSSTIRLELFSDGVFAIAIKLLVMEIKLPTHMDLQMMGGPWSALAQQWRDYVGCTLTFAIMGVLWANHHAMFEQIRRVDRWLLLANMQLMNGSPNDFSTKRRQPGRHHGRHRDGVRERMAEPRDPPGTGLLERDHRASGTGRGHRTRRVNRPFYIGL